ncbi:MAG: nucleoside kinase [Spirochaetota bacterium]
MISNITYHLGTAGPFSAPAGIRISEAMRAAGTDPADINLMAMRVNNEITSLSYPLEVNARLEPVTIDSTEGRRVYRRSLCFLLAMAFHEIAPQMHLVIGHSLGDSYYYTLGEEQTVDAATLAQVEKRMRSLVQEDLEITRCYLAYEDAIRSFEDRGMMDTALLVKHKNASKVAVYTCGGIMDLAHGPLAPRTGVLKTFALEIYEGGFILRFPGGEGDPRELGTFRGSPLLFSVYQEHKEWGRILDVGSAGRLNDRVVSGGIREFIWVAEALQNKRIAEIGDRIVAESQVRMVLIAGPSSSGKTTFAKKLEIQLRAAGRVPVAVSLDDYFVPREQTPRDEEGNYDFESLKAIDVTLLNEQLLALFEGEEVRMPVFDFKTGSRVTSDTPIRLRDNGILILEGIHGLNDQLTPRVSAQNKFKVYVSALTQLNLDDHTRIPTTDNRLIRRMVRDYQFRGHSALDTLHMWPSVRRGENRNIFPYQDSADVAFNSALDYELAVLRNYAWPLLTMVKPHHDVYHEAIRLMGFLDNFVGIPERNVPYDSILREFIGQSGFDY